MNVSRTFQLTSNLLLFLPALSWAFSSPGSLFKNGNILDSARNTYVDYRKTPLQGSSHPSDQNENIDETTTTTATSRASFIRNSFAAMTATTATTVLSISSPATASTPNSEPKEKLFNLSNEELAKIVTNDMVKNSFLVTALLTREIYDESATFTDEIDTYTLDKWIVGTQRLFVSEGSSVELLGDVEVNEKEVKFKFQEDLMFRIPFRPVVYLSGTVVLKRDAASGLITSYREIWDQDVATVLKSARI